MIEIWMKNHLVCDSNCNIVNSNWSILFYKEWQIMLGLHLVLVTTTWAGLQLGMQKTNQIGSTEYKNLV